MIWTALNALYKRVLPLPASHGSLTHGYERASFQLRFRPLLQFLLSGLSIFID